MKNGVIRPNAVRWTGLYEGTGCALPFEVRCGQVRGLILGASPGNVRKFHLYLFKREQRFELLKMSRVFCAFRFAEKQSG
jgi:hypothetical protein